MITYPNQKTITTRKQKVDADGDALYTSFLQSAGKHACKTITKLSALKMWIYLEKNADGYFFALSPKDCATWGITRDMYKAGIAELLDKGFIRHQEANRYIFCDAPAQETVKENKLEKEAPEQPGTTADANAHQFLLSEEQKAKEFFEKRKPDMVRSFEHDNSGEAFSEDDDRLPFETDEDYAERKKYEAEHGKDEKTESPTKTFLESIREWNRVKGTSRKTDKMKTWPECLEDF